MYSPERNGIMLIDFEWADMLGGPNSSEDEKHETHRENGVDNTVKQLDLFIRSEYLGHDEVEDMTY